MAIVVKWAEDGHYLVSLVKVDGSPEARWSHDRKRARRFESQHDARVALLKHFDVWPVWVPGQIQFVRLVPRKRHASSQP